MTVFLAAAVCVMFALMLRFAAHARKAIASQGERIEALRGIVEIQGDVIRGLGEALARHGSAVGDAAKAVAETREAIERVTAALDRMRGEEDWWRGPVGGGE